MIKSKGISKLNPTWLIITVSKMTVYYIHLFKKKRIYIQSSLSIATIEGSSEKMSHKTGSRWIEVMIFAPKISRGKT